MSSQDFGHLFSGQSAAPQTGIAEEGGNAAGIDCTHYFEHFLPSAARQSGLTDLTLDVTIGFTVNGPGGGQWSVELGGGQVAVRHREPLTANVSYVMDKETFTAVVRGRLTPQDAFLARRIEIAGDVEKGLVLAALFGNLVRVFPYQHTLTPEAMDAKPVLV